MDPIGKSLARDGAVQVERATVRAAETAEHVVEAVRAGVLDVLKSSEATRLVSKGNVAAVHGTTTHLGLEVLLHRTGLAYDAATREWLGRHGADDLLRVLAGFKLHEQEFLAMVKGAQAPGELGRIKAIADYVRGRPWISPDLKTVARIREALPELRAPTEEQLAKALAHADTRFHREYSIAEPWVDNAHDWQFIEHNGMPGDEGASYWLRAPNGEPYLAKVPPQPRRGVNERVGYALYTALDIKVNQVQFGQRDWVPLLTLHKRLPGDPVALNRVAHEIGIDKADYRVSGWPYPVDNIGTGPSTWGRPNAEEYLAKIRPRLVDPAAFDKLHFAAQICNDPDLKPGNILASAVGHALDGRPVYDIYRIDFGIMMDGYALRNLEQDLSLFRKYLEGLDDGVNQVYLRNVLPSVKQFASLSDAQLTGELMGGLHHRPDGASVMLIDPTRERLMRDRLLQKRDMVRSWLERHPDLAR